MSITNSIAAISDTIVTRRASYNDIKPKRADRRSLIYDLLGDRQLTASEITEELLEQGRIKYYDRNFVAPRLTELRELGVIRTNGKRLCKRTGKNVAIWERVELFKECHMSEKRANGKGGAE